MTKLAAYAFTFLYLVAMYRPVAPVIEYLVNQDRIAELFCVNKDKPEMHCNGQCYLMKILKEQQKEKKSSVPPISLRDYPIGFVKFLFFQHSGVPSPSHQIPNTFQDHYSYLYTRNYFHPPPAQSIS